MARKAPKPTPKKPAKPAKKAKKPSRDPVTMKVTGYDPKTGQVVGTVRKEPQHVFTIHANDPGMVSEAMKKQAPKIAAALKAHVERNNGGHQRRRRRTIVQGTASQEASLVDLSAVNGLDIRSTGRVPGPPAASPWFESSTLSIVLGTITAVVALTLWLAWRHS